MTSGLTRHTEHHWDDLIDGLAAWLAELELTVFECPRVLTPDSATARLVKQELATRTGIFAGIDVLPVTQWVARLPEELGEGEPSPWRGRALELAIVEVLADPEFTASYPVVAAQLERGPARRRSTARRLATLLRAYADHQPTLLGAWLDDPLEAAGALPEHLAWQPELVQRVTEVLEWDPVEELTRMIATLKEHPSPPTALFHCPDLPTATLALVGALAAAQQVPSFELHGDATPQSVTWLGSHGPARQAEVLRDALCQLLEEHPQFEPRHILVVVSDVARWWPALALAFTPTPDDPHPGRALRLQRPVGARPPNPVLRVLAEATRLRDSRAEASQVLDLLTAEPLAYRWRLPGRDELTHLVTQAGIRWGLDAAHRARHGLPSVVTNTWARGLDRLLAGLTVTPGSLALPLGGAEGVVTSQLELLGNLSEVLSRLRRYAALTAEPAPMAQWVARAHELLADVVGLPPAQDQLIQEATSRLTRLARQTATSTVPITAADFAAHLDRLAAESSSRPQVGNGNLTVVSENELAGVGFPVVALLGVSDQAVDPIPDAVPGTLPELRSQRLERLERHARAAQHLLVVHQHRSEDNGAIVEPPTTLSWLWRRLGITPTLQVVTRADPPPTGQTLGPAARVRRRAALALPLVADQPAMQLDEIVRFLRDPAAAFLRERAGIRDITPPQPEDSLTLQPAGLGAWGIRSRLLTAARTGVNPMDAVREEARRETLPMGRLSAAAIDDELELIRGLWSGARNDWDQPVTQVPIHLEVAGVYLTGLVRLRGAQVVALSPSDLPNPLFEPWVHVLALAVAGAPATARVHLLRRHFSDTYPQAVTLTPPAEPLTHLEYLVRGTRLTRSRLVPVPPGPARAFALAARSRTLNRAQWELPTTHWDSPWAWRSGAWARFYTEAASELFTDPITATDPPGYDEFGAFGAWAMALHAPLLEATQ